MNTGLIPSSVMDLFRVFPFGVDVPAHLFWLDMNACSTLVCVDTFNAIGDYFCGVVSDMVSLLFIT